jgi:hypothetical protein
MAKQTPYITQQHWLFGLAACLWPIAFTLVGIFGSFPLKPAGALISRLSIISFPRAALTSYARERP